MAMTNLAQVWSNTQTFSGFTDMQGNIDLGNGTGDTISFEGRVDTSIVPSTDGSRDLGTSGLEFRDLFIDGIAHIDTLDVDLTATIVGQLNCNAGVTLGNGTSDLILPIGRFSGDLDPSSNAARDMGASGLIWDDLWIDQIIVRDRVRSDSSSSEMGFFVNAETGTVGSAGTVQIGTITDSAPSDSTLNTQFGNFEGAIGLAASTQANSKFQVKSNGNWQHVFLSNSN